MGIPFADHQAPSKSKTYFVPSWWGQHLAHPKGEPYSPLSNKTMNQDLKELMPLGKEGVWHVACRYTGLDQFMSQGLEKEAISHAAWHDQQLMQKTYKAGTIDYNATFCGPWTKDWEVSCANLAFG